MSTKDSLGDRMKGYEDVAKNRLTRRLPIVIRVDGKAFHTLTKGMQRPFDAKFIQCMHATAEALVAEIQNADFAYVQSDEISVLVTDYKTLRTEAWFGNQVQKIVSVAASVATAHFGKAFREFFPDRKALPTFDARVFSLPPDEVCNYFIWRQNDAVRNSIQSVGQFYFSPRQLHGVNCDQIQEKLFQEAGVNWNDLDDFLKRGAIAVKGYTEGGCFGAPHFAGNRDYVEQFVFPLDEDDEDIFDRRD